MKNFNPSTPSGKNLPHRLVIHCSQQHFYFEYVDLVCLQADGSQSVVYTRTGCIHPPKIVVCKTLKELEDMLPPRLFLRTHRSWLVNLQHVTSYVVESHSLLMSNNQLAHIAQEQLAAVLMRVEQF